MAMFLRHLEESDEWLVSSEMEFAGDATPLYIELARLQSLIRREEFDCVCLAEAGGSESSTF